MVNTNDSIKLQLWDKQDGSHIKMLAIKPNDLSSNPQDSLGEKNQLL